MEIRKMDKQRVAVIGPVSTALSVLNDNGHEVRIWGNIAEQIDEINQAALNTRYFKDTVLDEKSKPTIVQKQKPWMAVPMFYLGANQGHKINAKTSRSKS